MKSTGMIRKIDELGRIVIPKEIRNNLKIKDNEAVEIYVEEDKMILQKYNQMLSYEDKCNKLINIFDKVFNLNIIITDTSKVLFLSKNCDSKFLNNEITKEFQNLIKERKIIINKEIENLKWLKNNNIKSCTVLFPILKNTELLGAVFLISDKKISDYEVAIVRLFSLLIKSFE